MASKDTAIGISSSGSVGVSGWTAVGHPGGDAIQRWTASRKPAVVLDIIKGKTTPPPQPTPPACTALTAAPAPPH